MKATNKILISIAVFFVVQLYLASAFTITNVNAIPGEVAPGKDIRIIMYIRNNMNADFENIMVSLDLTNLPLAPHQSSSQVTINELNDDSSKQIEFGLIANSDALAGIYKIPVNIKYDTNVETSFISVIVNSKPVLSVDSESYVIKGKNNDISLKIVNSGLTNAKFLSMTIQDSFGVNVISQKYNYVGDVDSNDFNSVDLKIFVSNTAPSTISLPVKVNYKDSLNNDYKEDYQVSIRAYSQQEAINLGLVSKSNTGLVVFAIIMLVVLYLIYRYIRKKLKKRREKQEAV